MMELLSRGESATVLWPAQYGRRGPTRVSTWRDEISRGRIGQMSDAVSALLALVALLFRGTDWRSF